MEGSPRPVFFQLVPGRKSGGVGARGHLLMQIYQHIKEHTPRGRVLEAGRGGVVVWWLGGLEGWWAWSFGGFGVGFGVGLGWWVWVWVCWFVFFSFERRGVGVLRGSFRGCFLFVHSFFWGWGWAGGGGVQVFWGIVWGGGLLDVVSLFVSLFVGFDSDTSSLHGHHCVQCGLDSNPKMGNQEDFVIFSRVWRAAPWQCLCILVVGRREATTSLCFSFLDHKIKNRHSPVGSWMKNMPTETPQTSLFAVFGGQPPSCFGSWAPRLLYVIFHLAERAARQSTAVRPVRQEFPVIMVGVDFNEEFLGKFWDRPRSGWQILGVTSPELAPLSVVLHFWGSLCFPLSRQK